MMESRTGMLTLAGRGLVALLLGAATSCQPGVPAPRATDGASGSSVELRADRDSYRSGDRVTLALTNRTEHRWGYNACSRTVERESAGGWVAVAEPDRVCTMELTLLAPRGGASATTELPQAMPEGRYRIVLALSREDSTGAGHTRVASQVVRVAP